jgi:hypothetical protein
MVNLLETKDTGERIPCIKCQISNLLIKAPTGRVSRVAGGNLKSEIYYSKLQRRRMKDNAAVGLPTRPSTRFNLEIIRGENMIKEFSGDFFNGLEDFFM